MHKITPLVAGSAAMLTVFVTGCHRDDVRVYDVPREQTVAAAAPAAPRLLPAGWQAAPRGEMRVESFAIKGTNGGKADFGVVALPYAGDRDLENVNRWRSAVGQKALTDSEFANAAQSVTIGGLPGKLYEISGPSAETDDPTRILGATVLRNGTAWYFKMTGDDKLVAVQKPVFLKFLETYPFPEAAMPSGEVAAAAGDPHAGLNVGGAAADPHAGVNIGAVAPADSGAGAERKWAAPSSWQPQAPGMMQQVKFALGGGKAFVTVSEAGGGLGPNVTRWRGQLMLDPVSESEAEKLAAPLDLGGTAGKLVDLAGADKSGIPQRMVVVIVPNGPTSIFVKLMGDPAVVDAEKAALIEFAKKVK